MMPGAPGHHHQDTRSPRLWNAGFIRQAGEPRVGLPDESSVPVVLSGPPTNDGRPNLPVCPNLSASKRSDAGGTMGIRTKEKHLPLPATQEWGEGLSGNVPPPPPPPPPLGGGGGRGRSVSGRGA